MHNCISKKLTNIARFRNEFSNPFCFTAEVLSHKQNAAMNSLLCVLATQRQGLTHFWWFVGGNDSGAALPRPLGAAALSSSERCAGGGWTGPCGGAGNHLKGPENVIQPKAQASVLVPPCSQSVSGDLLPPPHAMRYVFSSSHGCFHCLVFKRWHSFNWKERETNVLQKHHKPNLVAVGLTKMLKAP